MVATVEANENIIPLWQVVSLTDYALPAAPTREAAAKGFTALWRLLRVKDQQSPEKTEEQLFRFSEMQLSRLVPAIDWHLGAEALEVKLKDWPAPKEQNSPIRFLIGPPYSGHTDILKLWANMRQLTVIEAPTPEQILAQNGNWFLSWPDDNQVWLLPNLERCYLRHADGLTVVRRLFEQASSGKLGFGVIGCDSWAWSFLQKVCPFRQPNALTLQAFDSERLKAYFQVLAISSVFGPLRFRASDSGEDILPPTGDSDEQDPVTTSPFLKRLAAHSRGILGVAWAYWRNSLCAEPDETQASDSHAGTTKDLLPQNIIWLRSGLQEPTIPVGTNPYDAFVLHCLLLHKSLPVDLLVDLLPLPRSAVTATLHLLTSAGLVEEHNNAWQVSARGYPVVRQFLKNNGYMVDLF